MTTKKRKRNNSVRSTYLVRRRIMRIGPVLKATYKQGEIEMYRGLYKNDLVIGVRTFHRGTGNRQKLGFTPAGMAAFIHLGRLMLAGGQAETAQPSNMQ